MRQFSDAHLAALAVLASAVVVSIWAPRPYPGGWVAIYARALATLILAAWLGEYVADVVNGTWTVRSDLPLQLTDAVSLIAIVALWSRLRLAVELLYFWALTASLQATLTPDLGQTFPSVYYFTYFTYHIGAVAAACLLVFGCGMYPRPRAAWRVFAITLALAAIVGLADVPDRRQLHVPAVQAGPQLATRCDRPVAVVHRRDRVTGTGDAHGAAAAGRPGAPCRIPAIAD
jgi:hypothetical integral membrane protein (TIGR02206 family)